VARSSESRALPADHRPSSPWRAYLRLPTSFLPAEDRAC
jgi:hypothetical protein